jgi:lipopolysaccharide/colanic/teichoic acid biosynthesis glycosyltransferase
MEAIVLHNYLKTVDRPDPLSQFVFELTGEDVSDVFSCFESSASSIEYVKEQYKGIMNECLLNDIPRINTYLSSLNSLLSTGQFALVALRSHQTTKDEISGTYPKPVSSLINGYHFISGRVFPKLALFQPLYFKITQNKLKILHLVEVMGRLAVQGFVVKGNIQIGRTTWVLAEKVSEPHQVEHPSCGLYIKLRRVGYNAKTISVYKLRTMYSYSEYLQDHVYQNNQLDSNGKFKDDFRITNWGRILRKYWIDELPMIVNWLKGDLKLVGVRPLSKSYFNLYPREIQELRTKVKPGLIPPYYAHHPKNFDEIVDSERTYLQEYFDRPFKTDFKYFWICVYTIIFKGVRSK